MKNWRENTTSSVLNCQPHQNIKLLAVINGPKVSSIEKSNFKVDNKEWPNLNEEELPLKIKQLKMQLRKFLAAKQELVSIANRKRKSYVY